jgi:surfeit locus 1 family protein
VNRGWVPRGWRDKNVKDLQILDEASESPEAVKKPDEKGSWWKFWSNRPKSSPEVIFVPYLFWHSVQSVT